MIKPALIFIASLSPLAFGAMSYSEAFPLEALSGSENQTFDHANLLTGIGIDIGGDPEWESTISGAEIVSATGTDASPSALSFDVDGSDESILDTSLSGTWTWYYLPELLPAAICLTGLALTGFLRRAMHER